MKYLIIVIMICVSGCEYIPSKVYEIRTTDGQILKLECPLVDRGRNQLTYLIDSKCIAVKD